MSAPYVLFNCITRQAHQNHDFKKDFQFINLVRTMLSSDENNHSEESHFSSRKKSGVTGEKKKSDGTGTKKKSDGTGTKKKSDGTGKKKKSDGTGTKKKSEGTGTKRKSSRTGTKRKSSGPSASKKSDGTVTRRKSDTTLHFTGAKKKSGDPKGHHKGSYSLNLSPGHHSSYKNELHPKLSQESIATTAATSDTDLTSIATSEQPCQSKRDTYPLHDHPSPGHHQLHLFHGHSKQTELGHPKIVHYPDHSGQHNKSHPFQLHSNKAHDTYNTHIIDLFMDDDGHYDQGLAVSKDNNANSSGLKSEDEFNKPNTNFLFKNESIRTALLECPIGLESLIDEDIFYLNPSHTFQGGYTAASRFEVLSGCGDRVLYAGQNSVCCSRFIIFSKKSFYVDLYNMNGKKVMEILGPLCILHKNFTPVKVVLANGELIGTIATRRLLKADYDLRDNKGEKAIEVKGNRCCPKGYDDFSIQLPASSQEIGSISKNWKISHLGNQYLDTETTGANFPPGMDVKLKALILGVLFFIEFQWYNKRTSFSLPIIAAGLVVFILIILVFSLLPIIYLSADDDEVIVLP